VEQPFKAAMPAFLRAFLYYNTVPKPLHDCSRLCLQRRASSGKNRSTYLQIIHKTGIDTDR
jgi:hypothetical protein